MKTKIFKLNGDEHRIDDAGNHFINVRCVNPKTTDSTLHDDGVYREAEIGDTYPKED